MTQQSTKKTELKSLQADEDARLEGMEQLQNWGAMLRNEPHVGPAGFKQSPMFKDVISRYADDAPRVRESARIDDAYLVMDIIHHLVKSDAYKKAIYLFYAEAKTNQNTKQALNAYNKYLEGEGYDQISESHFRKILNSIEIRIGTAVIICGDNDEWMTITKLMAG